MLWWSLGILLVGAWVAWGRAATTLLLFANSFGAVATAYALTGSSMNIVTILLYAQIRGDVLHDQNLGYALALGVRARQADPRGGTPMTENEQDTPSAAPWYTPWETETALSCSAM